MAGEQGSALSKGSIPVSDRPEPAPLDVVQAQAWHPHHVHNLLWLHGGGGGRGAAGQLGSQPWRARPPKSLGLAGGCYRASDKVPLPRQSPLQCICPCLLGSSREPGPLLHLRRPHLGLHRPAARIHRRHKLLVQAGRPLQALRHLKPSRRLRL